MSYADFLTEGAEIPAGSALTSTTTTSQTPQWYLDFVQQTIAKQALEAGTPLATFPGERVAGFTPDDVKSFDMTRNAAGAYQPGLAAANATAGAAAGTSGAAAAAPGMAAANSALSGALSQPGAAAASNPYLAGGANAVNSAMASPNGSAAGGGYLSAGSNAVNAGLAKPSGSDAAGGYLTNASNTLMAGANGTTGMDAANPYLAKATGGVSDVSAYMNPYQDAVVNRIGELGNRNLTENIMPALEGRYIKAGQFRGSGQMTDTARAVRDTQEGISAAQASALNQGYTQAQTAKGTDLTREGNLAATAGTTAGNDRSTTVNAGSALADVGGKAGALAENARTTDINAGTALGNIGTAAGNLAENARTTDINAGTALGNLGNVAGDAANSDRSTSANIGTAMGNVANNQGNLAVNDASNLNKTAEVQGALAGDAQKLGLTGAGAVAGVGAAEREMAQKNDDVAYADFLRQQGHSQDEIDKMVATAKGLQPSMPTTVSKEGIEPSGVQPTYDPSNVSNIISGVTGGLSIADQIKKLVENKP